ncbi:ammonium transporter [Helicobacter sp. 13S00401-1]|nr:ammonium transporter [Helicobacter sp. 13S00401-1]
MINGANTVFILLCTMLVLLMTPALAMFYSGMTKSKNALSTIMNSFVVFGVVAIEWAIIGFTLSFGHDTGIGIIGDLSFFALDNLKGVNENGVPNLLFMLFQMMFAIISTAIIGGSLVGRVRFSVIIIFTTLWSLIVYNILAHAVWSENGFLLHRGGLDFAGGGVVHISAGIAGLVGALVVGCRKSHMIEGNMPHNLPFSFLGAMLLFFGWLGFNAGSSGAINEVAVHALVATILAAAAGLLGWLSIEWIKYKKPTLLGGTTGLIAGLVAITPAAGYVGPIPAVIIGFLASPLCFFGISYVKAKLKYDDTLDAFGLHGIGGIWGGIATGLFASTSINDVVGKIAPEGLFYSGSFHLLGEQVFGVLFSVILSGVVSYVIFKILSLFMRLRVEDRAEDDGLDVSLHGEEAYNILE